jgi:hypothetical protein
VNATWQNVATSTEGRRLFVKWFDHVLRDDPNGEIYFKERVSPYTMDGVLEEIGSQWQKMLDDKRAAEKAITE